VDLLDIKGRIALALVESIFRRAGFELMPVGQREAPPRLGREDLVPDFFAVRAPVDGKAPEPARLVEVRYRPRSRSTSRSRGSAGPSRSSPTRSASGRG